MKRIVPLAALALAAAAAAPTVQITSPAEGSTHGASVDVTVAYQPGEGRGNPNVTLLELYADGTLVASADLRGRAAKGGMHVFEGVNLAAFANRGTPVSLVARAFQGNERKNNFADSAAVGIFIQTDETPPIITIQSPADGAFTNDTTPTVSGSVVDVGGAGVDPASLEVLIDGAPVSPTSNLSDPNTLLFSFTPASPLAAGAHTVRVNASDLGGNAGAEASATFTIDAAAPTVSNLAPADGSFTNDATPVLSASITDTGGSGLDLASIVVLLDGATVTSTLIPSGPDQATVSFTPAGLGEGEHTFSVTASDLAGNGSAPASGRFTVDLTPPVVTVQVAPADTAVAAKEVTVGFQDALSGLDESTRRILIDVVDRTADGTISGAAWTLSETFAAGIHSVLGEVRDRAGNLGQATLVFEVAGPEKIPDTRKPSVSFEFPFADMTIPSGLQVPVVVVARDDFNADDTGVATVELLVNGAVAATQASADARDFFSYVFGVTIPSTGSTLTLLARATDVAGNVSQAGPIVLTAGAAPASPPVAFRVVAPAVATAGVSINVSVTPVDASGEPVSGFTGLFRVSTMDFTASSGLAFFDGSTATIQVPITLRRRGINVLRAQSFDDFSLQGYTSVEVGAGPVSRVEVKLLDYQRLAQGRDLTELGALVFDAFENPIPNAPVGWVVIFFQSETPIGTVTVTAPTNADGVGRLPSTPIPKNATRLSATASVTMSPTVSGSFDSPVTPNVRFSIAFHHQTVEAGMPVSFTITAIDPETGGVKTDFVGPVYVWRYQSVVFGDTTFTGLPDSTANEAGENLVIMFTEADQGVKVVLDGIRMVQVSEVILAASTEPPSIEDRFTQDQVEVINGQVFVFATLEFITIEDKAELIGGFSNELVVVASRPAKILFTAQDLGAFPVFAHVRLVDRFMNGVFNERLRFEFTVDGSPFTAETLSDNRGFADAFGPTDLSIEQPHAITCRVSAPAYPPAQGPDDPAGVEPVVRTLTVEPQTEGLLLGPTDPAGKLIELGKEGQTIADLTGVFSGQTITEFVEVPLTFLLSSSNVKFAAATFDGDGLVPQTPQLDQHRISFVLKNTSPIPIPLDENGNPVPQDFTFSFSLTQMTVDVPDDGRIPADLTDGRLLIASFRESRTVAFLKNTLVFFGGGIIPAGRPALADSSGQTRAGVFCFDSENITRSLTITAGLLYQLTGGTFQVQLVGNEFTFTEDMRVQLESLDASGAAVTDPSTGEAVKIYLPLRPAPTGGSASPPNVHVTAHAIAVDKGFIADVALGGVPGRAFISGQGSVPADGQTRARVDVAVTFEDGTPAPNATVLLEPDEPLLPQAPTILQPLPTDAAGHARGFVSSRSPGTLHLRATVTVPPLDPEHPGFTVTTDPLRILFITDLRPILAVPGGTIRATLVNATTDGQGGVTGATPVGEFSEQVRDAVVLGIQVRIQPEGETGFRESRFAVMKGTLPKVEFRFLPSAEAFSLPDLQSDQVLNTNLFNIEPGHALALVIDDGDDATSADRPEDPNKRVIQAEDEDWRPQFERQGDTLVWTPQPGSSPFRIGLNRLKVTFMNQATIPGPGIAVSNVFAYTDEEIETPLLSSHFPRTYRALPDGDRIVDRTVLVGFHLASITGPDKEQVQNVRMSELLTKHRALPAGLIRSTGELAVIVPPGTDEFTAGDRLKEEEFVIYAQAPGKRMVLDEEGYYETTVASGTVEGFGLLDLAEDEEFLNQRFTRRSIVRSAVGRRVAFSNTHVLVAGGTIGGMLVPRGSPSAGFDRLLSEGQASGAELAGSLAIVADEPYGLKFFDLSTSPPVVFTVSTEDTPQDVKVSNGLAYVAVDLLGLQVVDPATQSSLSFFTTGGRIHGIDVAGSTAILAGEAGLHLLNISNPANPSLLGTFPIPGARDADHFGSILYVARGDSGVSIVDASNPGAPALLGSFSVGGFVHTVRVQGDLLLVPGGDNGLHVFSLANPVSPAPTRHYPLPGDVRDAAHLGATLVTAQGTEGFLEIDAATGQVLVTRSFAFAPGDIALAPNQDARSQQEFDISVEIIKFRGAVVGVFDKHGDRKGVNRWYKEKDMEAAGLRTDLSDETRVYNFDPIWNGQEVKEGEATFVQIIHPGTGQTVKIEVLEPDPGILFFMWLKKAMDAESAPASLRLKMAEELAAFLDVAELIPPVDVLLAIGEGNVKDILLNTVFSLAGPAGKIGSASLKWAKKAKGVANKVEAFTPNARLTERAKQIEMLFDRKAETFEDAIELAQTFNKRVNPQLGGLKLTRKQVEVLGLITMRSEAAKVGLKAAPGWKAGRHGFDGVFFKEVKDAQGNVVDKLWFIGEAKGGSARLNKYDKIIDYRKDLSKGKQYAKNIEQMSDDWVEIVIERMAKKGNKVDQELAATLRQAKKDGKLGGFVASAPLEPFADGAKVGDIVTDSLKYKPPSSP